MLIDFILPGRGSRLCHWGAVCNSQCTKVCHSFHVGVQCCRRDMDVHVQAAMRYTMPGRVASKSVKEQLVYRPSSCAGPADLWSHQVRLPLQIRTIMYTIGITCMALRYRFRMGKSLKALVQCILQPMLKACALRCNGNGDLLR